jgi:hypothetical protein
VIAMLVTQHRAHQSFCRISYGKADKLWGSFAWSPSMAFMPYVVHGAKLTFWCENYESWNNKVKVEDRAGGESVIVLGVSFEVVNPSGLPSSRMPGWSAHTKIISPRTDPQKQEQIVLPLVADGGNWDAPSDVETYLEVSSQEAL